MTPPAFVRMSGRIGIPARPAARPPRTTSGRWPPPRSYAWTGEARSRRPDPRGPRARASAVELEQLLVRDPPPRVAPLERAVLSRVGLESRHVEPPSEWIRRRCRRRPGPSPSSWSSWAATEPTLPNPCTTHRCSAIDQPSRSHAREHHHDTRAGRLLAEHRAPIAIGFPVTISGTAYPRCIE